MEFSIEIEIDNTKVEKEIFSHGIDESGAEFHITSAVKVKHNDVPTT